MCQQPTLTKKPPFISGLKEHKPLRPSSLWFTATTEARADGSIPSVIAADSALQSCWWFPSSILVLDLAPNFQHLVLANSVTLLLLQNVLLCWHAAINLSCTRSQMSRKASSSRSSGKHRKTSINYNVPLHHKSGWTSYPRRIIENLLLEIYSGKTSCCYLLSSF